MKDLEYLLQPVSPDQPSGENLEYDSEFGALERSAQGTQDRAIGDEVAGAPTEWRSVLTSALALSERTRDLRVAMYLARALLHIDGVQGFAQGLALVRGLVETFWETLYPELDPDEPDDATIRVNILTTLCDWQAVLGPFSSAPLVAARGLGQYGLRDLRIAKGEMKLPADWEGAAPELASIDAAFQACEVDELRVTAAALTRSRADLARLDELLIAKTGNSQAPDLSGLAKELKDAETLVAAHLSSRGGNAGEPSANAGQGGGDDVDESRAAMVPAQPGEIRSREDAVTMMEKIATFFAQNEPSSPIPLLMQRAMRLSGMDFLAILNDIAPDGLKQVEQVSGVKTKK